MHDSTELANNIGEQIKVHTYYKVAEDDISIYGFASCEELRMFELLISVSGIGAKSAARIVLELKDKLKTENTINYNNESDLTKEAEKETKLEDAISALQVLGYTRKDIEKTFDKIEIENLSVEELIKKGLHILGRV